jgi:hypothetical protein
MMRTSLWTVLGCVLVVSSLTLAGCGAKVDGTYQDPTGLMVVELDSGKATVFAMGQKMGEGTYKVRGNAVTIEVDGDPLEFTRNSDGSLTPSAGAPIGTLRKRE